jgi:hypothetical protein
MRASTDNFCARFRAALDAGRLDEIRAHAADLAPVSLRDALRICLLIRDGEHAGYEREVVRWVGRFAIEASRATIADLHDALEVLQSLPADPDDAMERLSALCVRHGVSA